MGYNLNVVNVVLKMMNSALKMMNFAFKNDEFWFKPDDCRKNCANIEQSSVKAE